MQQENHPTAHSKATRPLSNSPSAMVSIKPDRQTQHVRWMPYTPEYEKHLKRESRLPRSARLNQSGMTIVVKHELPIVDVVTLPDGSGIASTSGESIVISDTDGSERSKIEFGASVTALASVDQHVLASGSTTGLIHLWDIGTAKPVRRMTISSLSDPITQLAGNASFLVAGSATGKIALTVLDSEEPTSVPLDEATGNVLSIRLIAENEFAICMGSNDDSLAVYRSYRFDPSIGEIHPTSNTRMTQMDHVNSMVTSDDGRHILVASHNEIIAWKMIEDRTEMRAECIFKAHQSDVNVMSILNDRRSVVSFSPDQRRIRFWDRLTKKENADVLIGAKVTCITSNYPIVFGTDTGEVWTWNPASAVMASMQLFDGETLGGWSSGSDAPIDSLASMHAGGTLRIKHNPTEPNQDHAIWWDKPQENFVLRLQWRIPTPSKHTKGSGILLGDGERTNLVIGIAGELPTGTFTVPGHFAFKTPSDKTDANDETPRPAEAQKEAPMGQWKWNDLEVICVGNSVVVRSNGNVVNQGTSQQDNRFRIGMHARGSKMEFRHIEVHPAIE